MNKDLHNIDDLFKNSIDGHAEEVPPDVWKNIDHGLDKKQAAFYKRKYFAVRAAAILVVLIGGVTIAAILHFNKPGKSSSDNSSSQNSVSTSNRKENNGEKKESIENQSTKDVTVENKKAGEQNTVLNNNKDDKQIDRLNGSTIGNPKSSSKEYETTNRNTYSAQKDEAIPVAENRNKSDKQNETVKYKRVTKSSVDLVAGKQMNLQKKTPEQGNTEITETATVFQRTTHVDDKLLSINKVDLRTAFPIDSFSGSPIFLSASASSSSVAKLIRLKTHLGGWSISPMYAQNANLNTLKDDDRFPNPRNNSREVKRTEQEATSFTVGLGVQKPISRNIVLQSGIQYFSSETNIEPKTIFAKPDARGDIRFQFYCSSGQSYLSTKTGAAPMVGDSIKTNFSKSEISYLQVPLLISYKINFGRFSLMPSAGIQTNFLLKGKLNSFLEHQTGEEEVSSSIDGLRSKYLSGIIQPQVSYKLSDRISFDFNPNLSFSLSPINKETAVKTYQNMFSIGVGIRIKL